MVRLTGLSIAFSAPHQAAMALSFEQLSLAPVALDRLPDALARLRKQSFELGDFVILKLPDLTADGTCEAVFAPGKGYLKLVAAIAGYLNLAVTHDHGWPILCLPDAEALT